MWKKLLTAVFVFACGILLLPVSANAEEVTLKDMGNGFYLPTSFDLKAADGSFRTSPKIDPSLFVAGECQEREEMPLENGMKAVKWWMGDGSGNNTGYLCYSVLDAEGIEIYRAGRNGCGNLVVYMMDEDGNTLLSNYSGRTYRYEDGQYQYTDYDEEVPRDMEQFDASKNVTHYESYTKSYNPDGSETSPIITSHDTYWDEGGKVKNNQIIIDGQVASTWEDSDAIVFDDFEYKVKEPLNLTKQEWKMLEPCFVEGDHHICPSYTTALAGQPLTGIKVIMVNDAGEEKETVMYFTDAHIDIMEDENVLIRRHVEYADGTSGTEAVIHYDVIKKQCPLYLYDEMFASAELVECRSPKAEEMLRKQQELEQKKRDAVIRGSERQIEEEPDSSETGAAAGTEAEGSDSSNSSTYSERDGEPLWNQKVVGDVVPINGMIPVMLETWEHDGHVLLTLRDEDFNIVYGSDNGQEKSHTNYKYVYFTDLSILDNGMVVFRVAGTDDAGMSGNLNHINQGTTDTNQGSAGITTYYND